MIQSNKITKLREKMSLPICGAGRDKTPDNWLSLEEIKKNLHLLIVKLLPPQSTKYDLVEGSTCQNVNIVAIFSPHFDELEVAKSKQRDALFRLLLLDFFIK